MSSRTTSLAPPVPTGPGLATTATELFRSCVLRAPDAAAVLSSRSRLTYRALAARVDGLALELRSRGVGRGAVVGIALPRSPEYVVAVLAVHEVDAAFLPLDPTYPADRLELMVADAGAGLVLADAASPAALAGVPAELLDATSLDGAGDESVERPPAAAGEGDLAYVIYTSGSTGRPKGVEVTHGNLVSLALAQQAVFDEPEVERVALLAPTSFDASVWELSMALLRGTTLVIPTARADDPRALAAELTALDATCVTLPPSALAQLDPRELPSIRLVVSAGEACPPDLVAAWRTHHRFVNAYGPTETTVCAAVHRCLTDDAPVGRPLQNSRCHVVDDAGQDAGQGGTGQIAIGGFGVARGYRGRPAETARRFVPDPWGPPGSRLYLTGDLGRIQADGELEFLGRIDAQLKVRGFRIEPGEIEARLRSHAAVREAAVVVSDTDPDRRLVAYVVPAAVDVFDPARSLPPVDELRAHVAATLPEFMVPAIFAAVAELPRTPAGKLDRGTLAARALPTLLPDAGQPPATPTEDLVAAVWSQVLSAKRFVRTSNFFELGGHSLLATQVIARVCDAAQVDVPVRALFETPTLAGFAAAVDAARPAAAAPPLVREEGAPELSFAQERLWFLQSLEPDATFFSIPLVRRLRGPLDVDALRAALSALVDRHEVFRTGIETVDGRPVPTVVPRSGLDVPLVDLSGVPAEQRRREAERLAEEEAAKPVDLTRPPLLRARLLRLGPEEHLLLLTAHHVALDGWSMRIVIRDLAELYSAYSAEREPELDEPPIQYSDFARWQRRWLDGPVLEEGLGFWREALAGAPTALSVPTDRPRPLRQRFRGRQVEVRLDPEVVRGVRELALASGSTVFMTLLGVFGTLVAAAAGQEEVLVAAPLAGRARPELEEVVGLCLNTLPLRVTARAGWTVRELIGHTRGRVLDAVRYEHVPFEKIVEAVQPERTLSRNTLCQVGFSVQSVLTEDIELEGLGVEWLPTTVPGAKYDLAMAFRDDGVELYGLLTYNVELFEPESAERWARAFEAAVAAAVADPEAPVASLVGGVRPRSHARGARRVPEVETVDALVERWVERSPEAVAVAGAGGAVTYGVVARRANALAERLRDLGVGRERRVGICLPRTPDLLVAELAVLKAGGACVPVDVDHPVERLRSILSDAEVDAIVVDGDHDDRLDSVAELVDVDAGLADEAPVGALRRPEDLAFVFYTSGSTGTPKGVFVEHRSVVSYLEHLVAELSLTPRDRVLQLASAGYDASLRDLLGPLAAGACTILPAPEARLDADALLAEIERHEVTALLTAVPSLLRVLAATPDAAERCRSLRLTATSGESAQLLVDLDLRPFGALVNQYGPTECTMTSTLARGVAAGPDTVGRPIANVDVWVVDAAGSVLPTGAVGEICIGGVGLARGYLGDYAGTAARFVPSPDGAGRMFRTGDRGRMGDDGVLELLGRDDTLVKIRGHRVDLREIETALRSHDAVEEAVAVVAGDAATPALAAYATARTAVAAEALTAELRHRLPEHMIPQRLAILDALPRTSSGKVDRAALAALPAASTNGTPTDGAPETETERKVRELWQELLAVDAIGRDDDFFALGGHSLLLMVLASRLRRAFDVDLDIATAFDRSTLGGLAAYVDGCRAVQEGVA